MADQDPKPAGDRPAAAEAPQQAEVVLKDKNAHVAYSNFARVTATPEEVIVDFALNPNPFQAGRQEVDVSLRLIMNFDTAKRLRSALALTLERHEGTFGTVERDVNRRAHAPARPIAVPRSPGRRSRRGALGPPGGSRGGSGSVRPTRDDQPMVS